ncbi:integrin alpha-7-like, partial [Anomalospiza imberbis]|uniref:integrin alpha-7-like n=1 Tax=Anomalospiza imberbis TaxID=187417 RepID=UPI00358EE50C
LSRAVPGCPGLSLAVPGCPGLSRAVPTLSPHCPPLSPQVHFLRQGCGDDKICQSHLELRPRFCARLGDSDFLPLPRDEDGTAIFAVSDQKDVALEVQVTNEPSDPSEPQRDGDDAHQALLGGHLPPGAGGLSPVPPQDKVLCLANQNGSRVECELGNPLKRGAQVRFFLILSTSGISIHTTDLAVQLELSTTSEQPGLEPVVARARVVIELPLAVTGGCPRSVAVPSRLFFGGQVLGESAVSQRGPVLKTPGSAALTVRWPLELPNGKWLLYPLSLELGTPPVPCSPPANPPAPRPGAARPGGPPQGAPGPLVVVPAGRRRRNVTLVSRGGLGGPCSWGAPGDCARGTPLAARPFRCPLPSLERSELRARGRLWNGTFLEEFLDVENLELIVRAEVSVASPSRQRRHQGRGGAGDPRVTPQMSVSLHLDPGVAVAAVPWWVLPLAALLGLLLLALLVLGLWKVGFFRRAAPPAVPRFRAVRIPREQRPQAREGRTGAILRPQWAAGPGDRDGDGAAPGPA